MPNNVAERNAPVQISGSGILPGGVNLPVLNGLPSQVIWANQIREQISASFERLVMAVASGVNRYKGLEPEETSALLDIVEEHRLRVLSVPDAQYFLDHWQDPVDRVQRLIHNDERWKSIVEARSVRHPRPDVLVPLRYMGFDDAAGVRIFKFGRLPAVAGTPVFRVHASVQLFLKHKISFQDGPSMCSAIMAAGEVPSHQLTDDDCLAFISLRPTKADRKPPKRKPSIPPAS
jgi:hypothetical protein